MKALSRILILPASVLLSVCSAVAQTHTAPVGYLTYSFPAIASATTSYLSAPLSTNATFSGSVTAVGSSTLTVDTATWTTNQFAGDSTTTPASYVCLTSGSQSGRALRIVSNTQTQLTLDTKDGTSQTTNLNTAGFSVAVGDTLEISTPYTINSFFGPTGATAFPGEGQSLAVAGGIGLWNSTKAAFDSYYFNSGVNRWVKSTAATFTDMGNTIIPPYATVAISRPAGAAAQSLILSGRATTIAPLLKEPGGSTVRYFGTFFPIDITFSQIVLGSGWVKSNSVFTADTLSIPNGTVMVNGVATPKWDAYYQLTNGDWRKSGSVASQSSTVIPAGTAVAFLKRASVSGSASFFPLTLPYTP